MRWALTMIRLSAAWRNTSVSRTTGTARRADDVGEHLAGADGRQLVDVADQDQRRMVGHGLQQSVHQRHIDHRGLVDDEQVAVERVILIAPEAAVLRIDLQQPMDGLRLAAGALATAASPRGRSAPPARSRRPWRARIFRIELTSVVLPTPGPPVMTRTFDRRASRTASRWLSASVMPALASTHGMAFAASIVRPGQRALLKRSRDDPAMARSARCSPARKMQRRPSTLVGDDLAVLQLQVQRRLDDRRPASPAASRPSAPARRAAARSGPRPSPRSARSRCRRGRGSSRSSRCRACRRSGRRS